MGAGLPNPELAWGRLVEREITDRTGQAPEIVHTRYYTWTPDWEEFLLKQLAKGPFDLVILSPAKFGFQVYSADNRIRKLLGKRTGDWFKHQADGFDAKTWKASDEGLRRKLNRVAHRTARRVVGQSPLSNVETITDTYIRTMAHLARLEDTQVVVLISTHPSKFLAERQPVVREEVVRFRAAMRAEAERRRFDWIDREALWRESDRDRNEMFSDGAHKTAIVHVRLADAILEKIAGQLGARKELVG